VPPDTNGLQAGALENGARGSGVDWLAAWRAKASRSLRSYGRANSARKARRETLPERVSGNSVRNTIRLIGLDRTGQFAFWINLYNAQTVAGIWLSLDDIEHGILRRLFRD